MTGLDPGRHTIVEIASLVTDDDLAVIAEGPDLVVSATPEQLAAMDPVVQDMHTRSGLLSAIEASTLSLEDAGRQTLAFLKAQVPAQGSVPLCGNSIGTDRRFLAAQLPDIENWLHYRSVDVSTVKELCRRWYPDVLAQAPAKATAHRALDDVRESVAELAYYRGAIFHPERHLTPSVTTGSRPPPQRARHAHEAAHVGTDRHAGVAVVPRGHDVRGVGQPRPRRLHAHRARGARRRGQLHRHRRCVLRGRVRGDPSQGARRRPA